MPYNWPVTVLLPLAGHQPECTTHLLLAAPQPKQRFAGQQHVQLLASMRQNPTMHPQDVAHSLCCCVITRAQQPVL
jgi:hypothetical protein